MAARLPSSLQRSASSIAPFTAWLASGAGHDALGAREQHAGLEAGDLVVGDGLDQAELLEVADHRRHAVVAQAAGVEAGRHEGASPACAS